MKRLLGHLLLVLCLGLMFNTSVSAETKWITKKTSKTSKVKTLEQMYVDGLLTRSECIKSKKKILKSQSVPGCKKIGTKKEPKATYITKKKEKKKVVKKKVAKKQGCIKGNCSTGQGTFIYKSGDKYVGGWKYRERHGQGTYTYADGRIVKGIWKEGNIITKTQIAKKEPKKKEKKKLVKKKEKKKVVKKKVKKYVPEETQEDNIKPKIEIASSFTFKNPEYLLKGKVTDKGGSEKIYLFAQKAKGKEILLNPVVGGKIKQFKNGRFEIERFSLENEEIKLIARDEYRNETIKVVKVNIAMEEETEVASVYDELKPTLKGIRDNKRVAIIIGVESYEKLPEVKALYANNDAEMFKNFANRSLGIRPSNIKVLIDSKARKMDIIETLKLWLPKKITPNQTELFVFFSSHGYPSEEGLYLIPQDGDPRLLEESALSHKYIIDRIVKAKPKSVTMFIDACYSGRSKTGKVLVAGLKQIDHVATSEDIPTNFNIFSSSKSNQLSATIKEAEHGIFSYYLMKGLAGEADLNKDKQISNNELFVYLQDSVSQEAFKQNRDQNPILTSQNPDQILMKY
tara:strand:- start:278 stop:1990 length:1713 start_codon:yes stop_codon:yes gene_type:complete